MLYAYIFQKVDVLCGIGIKKVACGTQFSVALTKDGHVYTFGQGEAFSRQYFTCLVYTCITETFAFQFYRKCSKLSCVLFWVMNGHCDLHSLATFLLLFHEICHKDKLFSPLIVCHTRAFDPARRVPAKALPILLSSPSTVLP